VKKPSRIIGLLLVLALVGYTGFKISKSGKPQNTRRAQTPTVKVETPKVEDVIQSLSYTGDVLPNKQVGIYSKVNGALESISAEVGDIVRSGQVLARIDTTELSQQALQTFATYQNTKAAFSRAQALTNSNVLSKQEFDNTEAANAVAKSAFESARLRMDYAMIRAPFDGVITKRFLDAGALVNANSGLLLNLMDYNVVKIRAEVSEKETPMIQKGTEASVVVDAYPGVVFTGKVARRSEAIDLNTRTMSVEIEVPNRDHRLKPGMFATATILLDRRMSALTLPSNVIQKDADGYYVWRVSSGESQKLRTVIGTEQGQRTEIRSGIAIGDSIVTLGIQSLREGGKVIVSGSEAASGEKNGQNGRGMKREGR